MPIYKKVNKNFFKIWTPDMAYILGFFAADGYITHNRRGANFWNIQITDKKLLEDIKDIVESEHKINIRLEKGKEKTLYRLQIGSKDMCDDLRKLGMNERKTKSLSTPNIPDQYFSDFVRGYFDGDGCVALGYIHKDRKTQYLNIQTVFTSCSGDFLRTIKLRLEYLGINRGVLSKCKGNYYRLVYSVSGSLKLYDFMYNKQSKLFLDRKKLIYDNFIKMRL